MPNGRLAPRQGLIRGFVALVKCHLDCIVLYWKECTVMATSMHECACDLDWSTGEYSCRGNSPDCPVRFIRQFSSNEACAPVKGNSGSVAPKSGAEGDGLKKSKRYPASES